MARVITTLSIQEVAIIFSPGSRPGLRLHKQHDSQFGSGVCSRCCSRGARCEHSAFLRSIQVPTSWRLEHKQQPKAAVLTSTSKLPDGSTPGDKISKRVVSAAENCILGTSDETQANTKDNDDRSDSFVSKSRDSVARKSDTKVTAESSTSWARFAGAERALDHDEELSLSAAVQDMLHLEHQKDLLTQKLGRAATMEEWATYVGSSVFNIYARIGMGRAAKRKMIAANLPLVNVIAEQFRGKGLSHVELCQEGVFGLARSTEKYDTTYNTKFSTYSFMWIWAKMAAGVKKLGTVLRISRGVDENSSSLLRHKEDFQILHGRQPSLQELAGVTGVGEKRIQELARLAGRVKSMDELVSTRDGDMESQLEDPDLSCIPWALLMETELKKEVASALQCLTSREQKVLEMRYGLSGEPPQGRAQVGQALKLTYESIRLIEKKAFLNLRQLATEDGLRYYLSRTH